MRLLGKHTLITGAGSGIGRATAIAFAKEGASVALLGRTVSQLDEAAEEVKSCGAEAIVLKADVSNANEMQKAFEKFGDIWGQLDVLFVNAGVNGVWAPIDELTPEEWDQTLNINLKGAFLTLKYALPLLRKGTNASVIFDSSVNGTSIFTTMGGTAYSCSKAALVAFAKMAAVELAQDKIRVNAICPGWVKTAIRENTFYRDRERLETWAEYPLGNPPLTKGEPIPAEVVAHSVVYLASDDALFTTGAVLTVDGGESLI